MTEIQFILATDFAAPAVTMHMVHLPSESVQMNFKIFVIQGDACRTVFGLLSSEPLTSF